MPRAFSLPFREMAATGSVARIQFTREAPDVLVSARVERADGAALTTEQIVVRTLRSDGRTIDEQRLAPDGQGGAQVGLALLRVGDVRRFQVAVYCASTYPCLLTGLVTALHGLDENASLLLTQAISPNGNNSTTVRLCSPAVEVFPMGYPDACPVPKGCEKDIVPLPARRSVAAAPNYTRMDNPFERRCNERIVR